MDLGLSATRRFRAARRHLVAVACTAVALMVLLPGAGAKADYAIKDLPAIQPVMACGSLVGIDLSAISGAVGGTVSIASATIVPAGGNNPAEYCAVQGNVGPGANTIVMQLPTLGWTQRYLQTGCGGLCGNANINYGQSLGCQPVTNGQIASATSDMGGPGGPNRFLSSPRSPDRLRLSRDVTAEVTKEIIHKLYGREALMETQRYPGDFDGIAAGALANNPIVQNTYHHAWRVLANQATWGDFNSFNLPSANLSYVHSKVVAACDALDGVVDGVIDDPRVCNFDTDTLVCANNRNEAGCLTKAQADSVRKLHDGAVTADGVPLEPKISPSGGPNSTGQFSCQMRRVRHRRPTISSRGSPAIRSGSIPITRTTN
jgi:feruloyl esterase